MKDNRINLPVRSSAAGIKTGIDVLDEVIGDMLPGDIILVGSRPLGGKGPVARMAARYIGSELDMRVTYFKLEEGGTFSLPENVSVCYEYSLHYGHMRYVLEETKPRFIIIDCLQRLPYYPKGKRRRSSRRAEELMQQIKAMAKEFGVPVMITTQLRRRKSLDLRPLPEDIPFRESLMPYVDTCLLLHQKGIVVNEPPNDDWRYMYIDITKSPGGKKDTVRFRKF